MVSALRCVIRQCITFKIVNVFLQKETICFPRLAGRIRLTLVPYMYFKNPLQNIQEECSTENTA